MSDLESKALETLRFLVSTFGLQLVQGTLHTLLGETGDEILHEATQFVAAVLRAVTSVVEAEKIKAILDAEYVAADAVASAAEKAKFG